MPDNQQLYYYSLKIYIWLSGSLTVFLDKVTENNSTIIVYYEEKCKINIVLYNLMISCYTYL